MKKGKKLRGRKTGRIEFVLGRNESLVASLAYALEPGIERVIVENKKGRTKITIAATSGSRFEFLDQRRTKGNEGQCDFWVANLKARDFLTDVLRGKFWSQFNWGELFGYRKNKKFSRLVDRKIRELVDKFLDQAAGELNEIKRPSRK